MKRKMMTRFSAGCLTLLLMFGSVCRVQAAQEPAEPNAGQSAEQMVQTGSVTVQLTPGKRGNQRSGCGVFPDQGRKDPGQYLCAASGIRIHQD